MRDSSKSSSKSFSNRNTEIPVMDLDIFESDSSYSSQGGSSTYTDDDSTYCNSERNSMYSGTRTKGCSSSDRNITAVKSCDSDESESAFKKIIGNMFACGGNDAVMSKDELTINDCDDDGSIISVSSKYSAYTSNSQREMMSDMNKKLEYSERIGKLGRISDNDSNDDDDDAGDDDDDIVDDSVIDITDDVDVDSCANGQLGTLGEIMTKLRVNREVPLFKKNVEREDLVSRKEVEQKRVELEETQYGTDAKVSLGEQKKSSLPKYDQDRERYDVNEKRSISSSGSEKANINTASLREGPPCRSGEDQGHSDNAKDEVENINDTDGSCEEVEKQNEEIVRDEILKEIPCEKVDFDLGASPLYRAIDTRSWKQAYKILRKSPKEASTWVYRRDRETSGYKWMFLPLHVACFSGAPLDLVKKLVKACPQAVRMAANGGKLPLHIACETLAHSSVITFLHSMYSEALYAIDESGNTPLQEAMFCESKSGRARVMKLLTLLTALEYRNSDDENTTPTAKEELNVGKPSKFTFKMKRPVSLRKSMRSSS